MAKKKRGNVESVTTDDESPMVEEQVVETESVDEVVTEPIEEPVVEEESVVEPISEDAAEEPIAESVVELEEPTEPTVEGQEDEEPSEDTEPEVEGGVPNEDSTIDPPADVVEEQIEEPAPDTVPENEAKAVEEEQVVTPTEDTKKAPLRSPKTIEGEFEAKLPSKLLKLAQAKYGASRGTIRWTDAECKAYLDKDILPAKTTQDNWVNDVNRESNLKEWDQSEIIDFVNGEIKVSSKRAAELVWGEIYLRYKLPGNLTIKEAKQYILNNKPIEYTDNGVLVKDDIRESLWLDQWTYKEVRAALLGNIKTKKTHDELVQALRENLDVSDEFSEELLTRNLEKEKFSKMSNMIFESKLEEYKRGRTAPTNGRKVGDANAMLLRQVRKLIGKPYPEFKEGWNALTSFVKREENTLFHDRVRYEHWDQVPLSGKDLDAITDLLTLLVLSVDPVNRQKGLGDEMIFDLVRNLGTQEEIEKIVTYYRR